MKTLERTFLFIAVLASIFYGCSIVPIHKTGGLFEGTWRGRNIIVNLYYTGEDKMEGDISLHFIASGGPTIRGDKIYAIISGETITINSNHHDTLLELKLNEDGILEGKGRIRGFNTVPTVRLNKSS